MKLESSAAVAVLALGLGLVVAGPLQAAARTCPTVHHGASDPAASNVRVVKYNGVEVIYLENHRDRSNATASPPPAAASPPALYGDEEGSLADAYYGAPTYGYGYGYGWPYWWGTSAFVLDDGRGFHGGFHDGFRGRFRSGFRNGFDGRFNSGFHRIGVHGGTPVGFTGRVLGGGAFRSFPGSSVHGSGFHGGFRGTGGFRGGMGGMGGFRH
jgi:hypothetical protein